MHIRVLVKNHNSNQYKHPCNTKGQLRGGCRLKQIFTSDINKAKIACHNVSHVIYHKMPFPIFSKGASVTGMLEYLGPVV